MRPQTNFERKKLNYFKTTIYTTTYKHTWTPNDIEMYTYDKQVNIIIQSEHIKHGMLKLSNCVSIEFQFQFVLLPTIFSLMCFSTFDFVRSPGESSDFCPLPFNTFVNIAWKSYTVGQKIDHIFCAMVHFFHSNIFTHVRLRIRLKRVLQIQNQRMTEVTLCTKKLY